MPRQTFLTRESFVDAPEKLTRDSVLSLPAYLHTIKLMAEKDSMNTFRFSYGPCTKDLYYHIDVSILPLNDQYTRASLHASHPNNQSFYSDPDMTLVLHDFESAIHASVKGDLSIFTRLTQPKPKPSMWQQVMVFLRAPLQHPLLRRKGVTS